MRVRVVCVHACVLHLFIEERFISGLDVYLFSTNRHCCEILWVNFTNTTSHLLQIFFVLAPPSQKPSTFIGQRISLSLSRLLSLALRVACILLEVQPKPKNSLIWCMLSALESQGFDNCLECAERASQKGRGTGTGGGPNGPDAVTVRVSLCDAPRVQTGRGAVVANQQQGLASWMSQAAEHWVSDTVESLRWRQLEVVPVVPVLILSVPSGRVWGGLIFHISTTHLLLQYVLIIYWCWGGGGVDNWIPLSFLHFRLSQVDGGS